MKSRNISTLGSIHPILFFACIYVVALLFSIFICSTLFYSLNPGSDDHSTVMENGKKVEMRAFANR
jgi:hypothetical protein